MTIYLFETRSLRDRLSPLTENKTILELLAGGISILDAWNFNNQDQGIGTFSVITEAFLSDMSGEDRCIERGDYLVFAGLRPVALSTLFDAKQGSGISLGAGLITRQNDKEDAAEQQVLAARLKEKLAISEIRNAIFDRADPDKALQQVLAPQGIQWQEARGASQFFYPEDILHDLGKDIQFAVDCQLNQGDAFMDARMIRDFGCSVWGRHEVVIEQSAEVRFSLFNTENGPIYIGKNAQVMEGCLLRGPLFLGENATLKMGTRIYGPVVTGRDVVLGGEIKNCIFHEGTNKGHDGYLGDSIIGAFCNFGAGSGGSNVKNTGGAVRVYDEHLKGYWEAGQKFGALVGDYTRIGVGTQLTTGAHIGLCCNLFGLVMPPKYVRAFSWGSGHNLVDYQIEKAVVHIDNWLRFKHRSLDKREIQILNHIFDRAGREC